MKCTECGKEIPDGENTLCEECQKKQVTESEKVEKEDVKKEEKKKPQKEKMKKEEKSSFEIIKNNKKVCYILIAIIVVLVVLIVIFATYRTASDAGNTIGNIRNYGYGTSDGKWNYYLAPNEDSSQVGIYKIKNNGQDKTEVLMNDMDIVSINVYNNYLYFIGIGAGSYSENDSVDNKIYRVKTDGTDLTVINDNEFNNECYEIYVVKNAVYYIGTDNNIYKMNLDGSKRKLVSDNGTGYIGITDKYILYNVANGDTDDYITYIMTLDGKNARPIIENTRLYSIDVCDDYVYYTNVDKQICRTKIDSGNAEVILDRTAYNLNLNGDYLYFLNYTDAENDDYSVCLFRIKADGSQTEPENLKKLSSYSSYIDVLGDWIMYMDYDETSTFINFVKTDGSEENKVFNLQYENISIDEEGTEQDVVTPDDGNTVVPVQ